MDSEEINIDNIKEIIAEKVVNKIIPALFLLISSIIVTLLPYPDQWLRLIPAFLSFILLIIITMINKFGSSKQAASFMIFCIAIIIITGMSINGGIRNPVYFAILPLLAIVSWLYNKNWVIAISLLSVFVGVIFIILDYFSLVYHIQSTEPIMVWLLATTFVILIIPATLIPSDILKKSLVIARERNLEAQASACKAELASIKLAQREEDLRITLNSIGDAVVATDAKGFITRFNKRAETLTGWTEKEALFLLITDILKLKNDKDPHNFHNPVTEVLTKDSSTGVMHNIQLLDKNNNERQINYSASPIRNKEGKLNGVVIVFRDVTEEYLIQEQLRQSRKMDAIGQLAGGVAHDFNNMLLGIMGATDLLKKKITDEKNIKYINIITQACEKAEDLTNKLLAFGRKKNLDAEPIEVNDVIRTTIDILSRTINKKIEIRSVLTENNNSVSGDYGSLQNAFLNLAINASQAMKEGGILEFKTQQITLSESYCRKSNFMISPGNYLKISISDNGSGIAPDIISKIFEPFYTTKLKGEGVGLGLSAVYGIIQQHSGEITVKSQLGKGTNFDIFLRLINAPIMKTEKKLSPEINQTATILLVDDEEIVRFSIKALLEENNYTVLTANNGLEGLQLFRRHKKEIKLVILDMMMPVMNGTDCFLGIKNESSDTPVIIISGFTDTANIAWLKTKGLSGFIHKPFKEPELINTIKFLI